MMTRIADAVEGIGHSFDRPAILDDGRRTATDRPGVAGEPCLHTYDLLAEAVDLLAAELRAAGVRSGDRVAVYIHFGYPALLAALAVDYAGAVAVPLDIREECARTEQKLRVAGAHWVLGHTGDGHIVEDVVGVDDSPMTTVAEDYTLVAMPSPAACSEPAAGFAFCTPDGSRCHVVDAAVLTDTARTVARQWNISADDTVALDTELGEFEAFLAATATLISGATLCLTRRAEHGRHAGLATMLVHGPTAAERSADAPGAALSGHWSAAAPESAGHELRQLRFAARPQNFADSGQIRRCG
ncbi:hypothetical protein GCM10027088_08380 [Nocardia goodfellowii]|uniref:Acyl-CoA synthetase (AMP-forming)/AMP-acid ligase II n=2 Tax=Nocardia goodfellowii TaxID=882446 RepID=A0ABS4QF91_9NOCA|nr:acyl-CoA synthetase (AMP-forming)/AMP-acid ligase II [Nocardia goodfellowii]